MLSLRKAKICVVLHLQSTMNMDLNAILTTHVQEAVSSLKGVDIPSVELQPTRKDFTGDITLVVFPMLRYVKGNPEAIGREIGEYLKNHVTQVEDYNVIKGFLNLEISDSYYLEAFNAIKNNDKVGALFFTDQIEKYIPPQKGSGQGIDR